MSSKAPPTQSPPPQPPIARPLPPSVRDWNELGRKDFAVAIHALFEPAPPLVDHLYAQRPFDSLEAILDTAQHALLPLEQSKFTRDELLAIVNAHPRIGAKPQTLSAQSYQEQGYGSKANTTTCPTTTNTQQEDVAAQLERLNREYEQRYGFKFIVFVNGRPRSEIVPLMEERIRSGHTVDQELAIGLQQMLHIARDRLRRNLLKSGPK